MIEYRHTATADVPADELFAFLSHPENLPRYFPEMKVAEPQDGDSVHVKAEVRGERVAGEAWLHTGPATRSLSWGAEGPGRLPRRTARPRGQRGLERTVAAMTHTATADVAAAEGQGRTSYNGKGSAGRDECITTYTSGLSATHPRIVRSEPAPTMRAAAAIVVRR